MLFTLFVIEFIRQLKFMHPSCHSFVVYRTASKLEKKQFRGKKLTFDFCSTTKFRPYILKVSFHLGDSTAKFDSLSAVNFFG